MTTTQTIAHVRRPQSARGTRHPHSPINDRETFPTPVTYCGAQATTSDFDRRDVTTKAAAKSEWIKGVCPGCLAAVAA